MKDSSTNTTQGLGNDNEVNYCGGNWKINRSKIYGKSMDFTHKIDRPIMAILTRVSHTIIHSFV